MDDILELINRRERQMLVHSYIYYVRDRNLWTDHNFNKKAVELADLIKSYPDIFEKSEWKDAFRDWDGSSGAYLPLDNEWVINKGEYLLRFA
jgi:hypothetical protein